MLSTRNLFAFNNRLQSTKCEQHQKKASKAQTVTSSNMLHQRREPNPEYHHAPRTFVQNFQNFHKQSRTDDSGLEDWNARYRWADFRRRMIYGTHDI